MYIAYTYNVQHLLYHKRNIVQQVPIIRTFIYISISIYLRLSKNFNEIASITEQQPAMSSVCTLKASFVKYLYIAYRISYFFTGI